MYILGINAYHGDASAALIRDGKLIAAAEEERFNRFKHCAGFPKLAIQYCLAAAGIGIEQVDHIGIYTSHKALKGLDLIGGDNVPETRPIGFSTLKGLDFVIKCDPFRVGEQLHLVPRALPSAIELRPFRAFPSDANMCRYRWVSPPAIIHSDYGAKKTSNSNTIS